MEKELSLPQLSAEQIRVLGVLIEKSKTTPEYYPLSLNGLTTGCNQKTSRKPVVNYSEEQVGITLQELKQLGLVATATGGSMRTTKYKHNLAIAYPLIPSETTILCLLFLRGALTPGEINTNSGRMHEFETLEDLQQQLDKLSDEGYIQKLPKAAGQKEQRYIHCFAPYTEPELQQNTNADSFSADSTLQERVNQLEKELAVLKERFEQLYNELMN